MLIEIATGKITRIPNIPHADSSRGYLEFDTFRAHPPNKPTHIVYHVKAFESEGGEPRSFWTRVGAAWENKDGKGLSLLLNLLPVDGRLVVRTAAQDNTPDEVQAEGEW